MRKILYSIFELDLAFKDGAWHDIPLIMGTTGDLDENSLPSDYILLRWNTPNTPKVFGDGVSQLRQADCDIMVMTSGAYSALHGQIELWTKELLTLNEISYTQIDLGFDKDLGKTQTTFSVVMYG